MKGTVESGPSVQAQLLKQTINTRLWAVALTVLPTELFVEKQLKWKSSQFLLFLFSTSSLCKG